MSKLLMYEWECEKCSHQFDDLAHSNVYQTPCPKCKAQSRRLISTPRIDWKNMGLDPGCPSAWNKWAKVHEQARKIDERNATDNGPAAWGADGADVRR